ncbi:MAG: universal stress protein [Planctomycetota bacterium]|nr:MAG: universal stress protein [Planctomycetota bacterium]
MEEPIQKIVAAIDFSNTTPKIIQLLLRFHATFDAQFFLVHVITDQVIQHLGQSFATREKAIEFAMEETLPLWEKVKRELSQTCFEVFTLPGIPHKVILEVAEQKGADLIVVGNHPPSRLQEIFIGSTARNLLINTSLPVLFVTPSTGKQ